MTTVLLIIFSLLIAAIGASIGSFLNVVIWRAPEKMSLISPPSHCPKCNAPVRWFDNAPIFSWFILRGKCRDCEEPISGRYPLVESLSCAIAALLGASILLGNWTGLNSQVLYWSDYSTWTSAWEKAVSSRSEDDTDVVSSTLSTESGSGDVVLTDSPLLTDEFLRLLRTATLLAIFWFVVIDLTLMLGFVEYDRGVSPYSLIWTAWICLLLGCALSCALRDDASYWQTLCIWLTSIIGGALGSLPIWFVAKGKKERLEYATLGAIWGFCVGYIGAFPGFLLLSFIGVFFRKGNKRDYIGLLTFGALFCAMVIESAFFIATK